MRPVNFFPCPKRLKKNQNWSKKSTLSVLATHFVGKLFRVDNSLPVEKIFSFLYAAILWSAEIFI